jgi:hypothetical protein
VTTRVSKSLDLNLTGNSVNLFEDTNTVASYLNTVNNPNTTEGDDNLYIKGGQGSMAVINLFNSAAELNRIRTSGWLINEANLIFHVDTNKMIGSDEPNRLYLYDLTHNIPIADFNLDPTSSPNPKNSKFIFGGLITKQEGANGRGLSYKVRITNQIRNLIKHSDSTNVKLGLVVTENIAEPTFSKLRSANAFTSKFPKSAVMNPLGTVLYGTSPRVPADKRLKLQIYYTKPN